MEKRTIDKKKMIKEQERRMKGDDAWEERHGREGEEERSSRRNEMHKKRPFHSARTTASIRPLRRCFSMG